MTRSTHNRIRILVLQLIVSFKLEKKIMISSLLLASPLQAPAHSIWVLKVNRVEEGEMSWHRKPY